MADLVWSDLDPEKVSPRYVAPPCLLGILALRFLRSQLYGRHRTTAIAAEIQQVSLKWDLEVQHIRTQHLKTRGMGLLSKLLKMLVERCVANFVSKLIVLDNFWQLLNNTLGLNYRNMRDRAGQGKSGRGSRPDMSRAPR
jgi:hypothetical protein